MLLSIPGQARGLTHVPLPLLTVGLRYANPTYTPTLPCVRVRLEQNPGFPIKNVGNDRRRHRELSTNC